MHSLEMAWLNGDSRVSTFDVEVSDDDVTWTAIATGLTSSGTTLDLETVDVTDTLARYVRIVGHGNSTNNGWNSITEVEIWGTTPMPPAAPASITATPGNGQVALVWPPSLGATQYHLKRSTTSGSGFTTIASGTGGTYLDTSVVNGTIYYYTVSAESTAGEGDDSAQVSTKPYAPISAEELVTPDMTVVGSSIEFTVETVPERIYQLQRNETLAANDWEDVGGPVIGGGTAIILADPEAFSVPKCFYRLQLEP